MVLSEREILLSLVHVLDRTVINKHKSNGWITITNNISL